MGRTQRTRRKTHQDKNAPLLNNNPTIITLLKTLKNNDWSNETRLELRDFPQTGRGVCSRTKIAANEILIKVPVTSMITLSTINTPEFLSFFKTTIKHPLSAHTLLSLFLCVEKHKNQASPWKFYLDSLPSCNPLTWLELTPPEVNRFPAHVAMQMRRFGAFFERAWDSTLDAINPLARCSCCNETTRRVFARNIFAWCYAMINTRGVYVDPEYIRRRVGSNLLDKLKGEPNLALCPFLDMFNHSPEAQTTPEIISEASGDFYALKSYRNERKYQQIFISYGPHDNVKLFVEYGFFIADNPFDTWPVQFEALCRHVKFADGQYKYIRNKGLDKDLYVGASGELSFNLKAVLFVSICEDQREFDRVYRADYATQEIDYFERTVCRLMDARLTLSPPNVVTHSFYEYLINFPINIVNKLRARAGKPNE